MKNTYSLRTKLFLLSGILILFSAIIGGISFWSADKIAESYSKIDEVNFPNTKLLLEASGFYRLARLEFLHLGVPGTSPEKDADSIKLLKQYWSKFDDSIKAYTSVPFQPGEEELFKASMEPMKSMRTDMESTGLLGDKAGPIDAAKKTEIFKLAMGSIQKKAAQFRERFAKVMEFHKNDAERSSKEAKAAKASGKIWIASLLIASLAFGFLFALLLSNKLVSTFRGLSTALDESSDHVSSASSQIASSSEELSQSTTQQAAALEQTASAIEEMSSMVSKSSENARNAASTSAESKNNAEKGKVVVEQMIQSMNEIDTSNKNIMDQINHSNSEIATIVQVIQEIGSKTKVINDIVFQTKLLSFNASVEAARAGENGKGFAVVAEEVGNLAQMSGNAAKEITTLLEGSIQKVEKIVNETKENVGNLVAEGKSKVEAGTAVAQQCSDVLNEIVNNVGAVSSMAEEIASASREQAQGVSEITKAMQQLDQMTQQNAATSEESANAAESLSGQARSLKNIVQTLVINIEGGNGISPTHHKNTSSVAKLKTVKKPVADKPNQSVRPKNNVVSMKKKTKSPEQVHHPIVKTAVGDGSTPSHTNPGFRDI